MFRRFMRASFWLAFALCLSASLAGRYLATLPGLKIIGAMVISLLLGMGFQVLPRVKPYVNSEISWISNRFLRLGIILLGCKLNIDTLLKAGVSVLVLALICTSFTIILCYMLARSFRVRPRLALLTAGGCGICGAAAVMGISPQLDADSDDSVLAVAIVAILGTVFTLISVFIHPVLGLSPRQYGIWMGASLHEIAHVVAAAGAGTEEALELAIIMKLARVLMLAPVAILMGLYYHRMVAKDEKSGGHGTRKIPFPYFMLGFIATAVVGTLCVQKIPEAGLAVKKIENLAFVILGTAMAALGFSVNFKVLLKRGKEVLLAASLASAALYVLSLVIAVLFY